MKLFVAVRNLIRDRQGGVLILFVFVFPVLLGFSGLVVDIGMAFKEKNVLITSAEASALAAAKYISSADRSAALAIAQSYSAKNHPAADDSITGVEVDFGTWEKGAFVVGGGGNAVRVTASRSTTNHNGLKTYFARLFGIDAWTVSASAIAVSEGNPICILVLHPNHSDAFDIDPGAQIDAPTCGVQVNSNSKGALELGSSSYVNVKSIRVVGGVDRSGSAVVRPTPVEGADRMDDPYASLIPPVNNSCGGSKRITTTSTITAASAFCDGLTIENATVTFSPGVYVIKGSFTLKNGASIRGDDVLIYLDGQGSDIFFYSATRFDLKASTTGPYAGIVLWSDKRNTHDHDIYSKFGASAEGTIYAPSSQVEFENNVVWEANCIRLVVSRLELDNNSKYRASDPSVNCRNNIQKGSVKLVR